MVLRCATVMKFPTHVAEYSLVLLDVLTSLKPENMKKETL